MPRANFHDYQSRCIYHLTLLKAKSIPQFSVLKGNFPEIVVERTSLGKIIETEILNLNNLSTNLKVLQYVIMPDHIHILLFVTDRLDRHLGKYLGQFKVRVGQAFREINGESLSIFEKDFDDRILHKKRSLDCVFKYIRENPYRLAIRRAHPEFFRRVRNIEIGGRSCQAYGNLFLLRNPFKEQVVVHRADTAEKRMSDRERWIYTASNGGVLVSPFISRDEKAIRHEAEELGCRIILVTNTTFGDRYKPSAHDFDLCCNGRLLLISAGEGQLDRRMCLSMNKIAENICNYN